MVSVGIWLSVIFFSIYVRSKYLICITVLITQYKCDVHGNLLQIAYTLARRRIWVGKGSE